MFHHKKYRHIKFWHYSYKTSNGPLNSDKEFFVIRRLPNATGLLSCYMSALGQLKAIDTNKYIPVMDIQSFYNPLIHNKQDKDSSVNAWEYYFERFSPFSMDEVNKSKNVTYSSGVAVSEAESFYNNDAIDLPFLKQWFDLDERFFTLKDNLLVRFNNTCAETIGQKRVLGVMFRESYVVLAEGRDHSSKKYKEHPGIGGHPVQPEIDEYINYIGKLMNEWNCDFVFVVSETYLVLDRIKKAFPGKVLYTNRRRIATDSLTLEAYSAGEDILNSSIDRVESNYGYLEEIFLLSKCTSLLAGKCSGSIVAGLWNRGAYEHLKIIQKGLY